MQSSPARATKAADANRAGADQRTVVTETSRRHTRGSAVTDAGDGVDLLLGGVEERRREAERHVTADDDEIEIEGGADRACRPTDEPAGVPHDVVGRLGQRPSCDRADRQTGGLRFETTPRTAGAATSARFDDDVADVPGVAGGAVHEIAVEHESAVDVRRYHDRAEALGTARSPQPTLGER